MAKSVEITVGNSTSKYDVSTTQGDTFILKDDKNTTLYYSNSIVSNLKYTTGVGISTYGNATYPDSFERGMTSNSTTDMVVFQCNKYGKKDTCQFGPPPPPSFKTKPVHNLFGKADKCGRCEITERKCIECTCGIDKDCLPMTDCDTKCKPAGPFYKCNWKPTKPMCVEDKDGKLTKNECSSDCELAKFAKCDY